MKTFKTFKIFKNSSKDWLGWSNKDWKALSKKLPTKQTLWKKTSQHFLTFPENGFNFVTQKFEKKTEKCPFQTLRTFVFALKVASKPFSKKLHMTTFLFKLFWTLCLTFPENAFEFVTQKFAKKLKNALFKR